MPFKRIRSGKNKGKYRSSSGRIYTAKQVRAYYATDAWSREPKKPTRRKRKKRKCSERARGLT